MHKRSSTHSEGQPTRHTALLQLLFLPLACTITLGCVGCGGSARTTPEWNYVFYRADDNGFPLNPPWGYQIRAPFTSNCGERKYRPCTDLPLEVNWDWWMCGMWGYDGHYNHRTVTYEGLICWASHSWDDDDYNINIYRPDNAGFQPGSQHLEMEFDSDEVIDPFGTPWWNAFHAAVDDSDAKAGSMINGKEAIVIGTLGLDCAHSCSPEVHPVMAMAIHVNNDPSDDTWAFFVRNWGDEGYCGEFVEEEPQREFTFRLPWRKGAESVSANGARLLALRPNDTWSVDSRPAEHAVLVTFTIAPYKERDLLKGEIHFTWAGRAIEGNPSPWAWDELWRSWSSQVGDHSAWSVAPDTCMGAPTAQPVPPPGTSWTRGGNMMWRAPLERGVREDERENEPEMVINAAIKNMTPEQRATLQRLWPKSEKHAVQVRHIPPNRDKGWWRKPYGPPSHPEHHYDPEYHARKVQRIIAIRTALGPELSAKLPVPRPDQIGRPHDH